MPRSTFTDILDQCWIWHNTKLKELGISGNVKHWSVIVMISGQLILQNFSKMVALITMVCGLHEIQEYELLIIMINCPQLLRFNTKVSKKLRTTPLRPRAKTKNLFINLRSNYSELFITEVQSLFRLFQQKPKERKKVNFWKEPHRHPYTMINFPSSQTCHSLRAFSEFWEQGRIAGG